MIQDTSLTVKTLEMETLDERHEQLCLNFARKLANHPKFKHVFPRNQKTHRMRTRNTELFKVSRVFTERYMKSSVIYMQQLLNRHGIWS